LQKRKGEIEDDLKPNGVLSRSAKEKSKLKLQSNSNSGKLITFFLSHVKWAVREIMVSFSKD